MIGYDNLRQTLESLISSDASTTPEIFGNLLGLATQNFSLTSSFVDATARKDANSSTVLTKIMGIDPNLLSVYNPLAVLCIMDLRSAYPDPMITTAAFKVVERLVFSSHRNQALLNQSGLCRRLFKDLRSSTLTARDVSSAQKTLRRLLEMGAGLDEAREIFRALVMPAKHDPKTMALDSDTLEVLRGGMRGVGKWPHFVAFGGGGSGRSGIEVQTTGARSRTFPGSQGFSFLVSSHVLCTFGPSSMMSTMSL